jgi:tetrapyrrole methylase family protein/MazG family protein
VKRITIAGLGPAGVDQMSVGAYRAISEKGRILARTERHPAVETLRQEGIQVDSLDSLYEDGADFDAVYEAIVAAVISEAEEHLDVLYAVPGHPLMGERTVSLLLERAPERGIEVSILSSPSFVDAAVTAARASVETDLIVLDAHALDVFKLDAAIPTLLYQVHDAAIASEAKLVLMARYPDEHGVFILREGQPALPTPLHAMDRYAFDHLTSVWIPPVPEAARRPTFDDLVRVITRLRAPGGCPWDREQTHETIKRNLLEEAYEVAEAIEKDDPDKLEEELGDFLMQPVMHAVIAAEEGVFTLDDVIAGITEKLIRRHPHVFGTVDAEDTETVLKNWEAIKRKEKGNADRTSVLDGVPVTMPALMRASDISRKAAKAGFEWPDAPAVLDKVQEEIEELRAEIRAADKPRAAEEIGDLLFSLVNVARWLKIDPEESLRQMVKRFAERFRAMEAFAAEDARKMTELSPEEWDAYWVRAKSAAGGAS